MKVADRCDYCRAQAFVAWWHPQAGRLDLCAHHSNANEAALITQRFLKADDDTHKLTERVAQTEPA